MKSFFIILLSALILSGCAKPVPPTVEEKTLMKIFSSLIGSGEYDKICNEGKITQSKIDGDVNALWYGNMQTVVAMFAAPMRIRFPKDSVEEGVQRLQKVQQKIEARAQAILKEQGCDSVAGAALKKSLELFVKTPPFAMYSVIVGEIEKQGGTVTQLTEEQNKVPSSNVAK